MSDVLVSVVMPAYNAEKYIGEAIKSILGQTYQNFELIIIDDGSNDNTDRVIDLFTDLRIRKWYRRSKRINWNNIVYKISERESFTEEDMFSFSKLPLDNKIIIGSKKYNEQTIVIDNIHEFHGSEEKLVEQYFDEAEYFNRMNRKIG